VTQHGGYYTVWQNLNAPGYLFHPRLYKTDNILMVTTTDTESQRIERMTDSQVKQEVQQVINRMFGAKALPVQEILIPRWHHHPLFRGSYSNWPIGALKKHHMNMRAPLKQRLWFAGEAMSADYYGFLHGAWLEGKSVAVSIGKCLTNGENCVDKSRERYKYVTGCDSVDEKPKFLFRQQQMY
jgi:polyamine oxidase